MNKFDPTDLMKVYDLAMDGVAEWLGYPPEHKYHKHALYLMADLELRRKAHGVGYPQVNTGFNVGATINHGYVNHNYVRNPTKMVVEWHEIGHALNMQLYQGEEESINNFLIVYIRHVKFGDDFDIAFKSSQDHPYDVRMPSHAKTTD